MKVVSLLAVRTGRLYPQEIFLVLISVVSVQPVLSTEMKNKRELSRSGLAGYKGGGIQILAEIVRDLMQ